MGGGGRGGGSLVGQALLSRLNLRRNFSDRFLCGTLHNFFGDVSITSLVMSSSFLFLQADSVTTCVASGSGSMFAAPVSKSVIVGVQDTMPYTLLHRLVSLAEVIQRGSACLLPRCLLPQRSLRQELYRHRRCNGYRNWGCNCSPTGSCMPPARHKCNTTIAERMKQQRDRWGKCKRHKDKLVGYTASGEEEEVLCL